MFTLFFFLILAQYRDWLNVKVVGLAGFEACFYNTTTTITKPSSLCSASAPPLYSSPEWREGSNCRSEQKHQTTPREESAAFSPPLLSHGSRRRRRRAQDQVRSPAQVTLRCASGFALPFPTWSMSKFRSRASIDSRVRALQRSNSNIGIQFRRRLHVLSQLGFRLLLLFG